MRALVIPILVLTLPALAEPLKPGAWELQMQYSPDGKRWPPPEAPKMECVLPEQKERVNSHVRRSLQVFGCRLQKLQLAQGKGEGLTDCWPTRQVTDFKFQVEHSADQLSISLQSQPGSATPMQGRLQARRTRECTAQEARITSTRLALEAEDGSGAY